MDASRLLGPAPIRPTPWWASDSSRKTLLKVADKVRQDA